MIIDDLKLNEHGYPDDAVLERITKLYCSKATLFMLHDFANLARSLPCSRVTVREYEDDCGERIHEVVFCTGGWSGCEDFIDACLGNVYIKAISYWAWERGGKHVFRTPMKLAQGMNHE